MYKLLSYMAEYPKKDVLGMLNLKRRPVREEALVTVLTWKMLSNLEEVRTLLHLLGYRMEVRFGHVNAVRESQTVSGDLIEDERHLFMVNALPMPCGSFLGLLQKAFAGLGYTIPTPTLIGNPEREASR